MEEIIKDRIKPKEVSIKGAFIIESFDPDGVQRIRDAFVDLPDDVSVTYAGGGRYTTIITDKDYKRAEETLKTLIKAVTDVLGEAAVTFERTDKK